MLDPHGEGSVTAHGGQKLTWSSTPEFSEYAVMFDDVMNGDGRRFVPIDDVVAGWAVVDGIQPSNAVTYEPGSPWPRPSIGRGPVARRRSVDELTPQRPERLTETLPTVGNGWIICASRHQTRPSMAYDDRRERPRRIHHQDAVRCDDAAGRGRCGTARNP